MVLAVYPILLLALVVCSWAQQNITVDDTDSAITYSQSPEWNTAVWAEQSPQPLNGTNHGSPNPGATLKFDFTGTAIYVYGYKNVDHGLRNITVDSSQPVQCDGRTGKIGSRALLFGRSGLSQGSHTIAITNTGTQGQYVNVDFFLVTTVSASPTPSPSSPSSGKGSFPIAAIAGTAAGGAVVILCIVLGACICFARRKRRARLDSDTPAVLSKPSSKPVSRPASTYTPTSGLVNSGGPNPRYSRPPSVRSQSSYYVNTGFAPGPEFNPYQISPSQPHTHYSRTSSYSGPGPDTAYPSASGYYPRPRPPSVVSQPASMISQRTSANSQQMSSLPSGSQQLGTAGRPRPLVTMNLSDSDRIPRAQYPPEKMPHAPSPTVQPQPQTPVVARETADPAPSSAVQKQGNPPNNNDRHDAMPPPPEYTE